MNFIESPSLPRGKVKHVLCDETLHLDILRELGALGISTVKVSKNKNLNTSIASHPDINVFHVGKGEFYTSQEYSHEFEEKLKDIISEGKHCDFFNNRRVGNKLSSNYPGDVLLNAVIVDKYLICNPKTVAKEILEYADKKVIEVKQGYSKCSICPVTENAIITDDPSIYEALNNTLDVLYIDHGEIKLSGYNYGFIGGSTGKLADDLLAFTGALSKNKNCDMIKGFCKEHGVYCVSLSNGDLYDYGSLIPITEEIQ